MNAHAIDVGEPGMLGVVDEIETVAPIDVARACEQPGRYGAGDHSRRLRQGDIASSSRLNVSTLSKGDIRHILPQRSGHSNEGRDAAAEIKARRDRAAETNRLPRTARALKLQIAGELLVYSLTNGNAGVTIQLTQQGILENSIAV